MATYLTLFDNKEEYDKFINSEDFKLPNVSFFKKSKGVRYHKKPSPGPEKPDVNNSSKVTLTFNATEDNLLAFDAIPYNVTNITIDGQVYDFTPIEAIETVGYITNDTFDGVNLPENIVVSSGVTSVRVSPLNNKNEFTQDTLVSLFFDGYGSEEQVTLGYCAEFGLLTYEPHKIIFSEMIAEMIGMGFVFYTPDNNLIETMQTTLTYSGGLESPLVFNEPGIHTIQIELNSSALLPFTNLSSSTLTDCELENITTMCDDMFKECGTLNTIFLGDKLNNIGHSAFEDCSSLQSIIIPNSVTVIGDSAFNGCNSLTSVTIGSKVNSVGHAAFYRCANLPVIDGIRYADTYLVEAVDKTLDTYKIKEGTKWIGLLAFDSCTNLETMVFPDTIIGIGSEPFLRCDKLTSVFIPKSVKDVDYMIFYGCPNLRLVYVSSDNEIYDSREDCHCIIESKTNTLIAGCKNSYIPNTVLKIGEGAFYGCEGLTAITIPSSVHTIDRSSFSDCYNLTAIVIPNSVTTIGRSAFYCCYSLSQITLGEGLTYISESCFGHCNNLKTIIIPDSVTNIQYEAFYHAGLTGITIPNSVTTIGYGAFNQCSNLTEVTLGMGLTTIEGNAFAYCTNLSSIICNAIAAPSLLSKSVFYQISSFGTLIYPEGSDYSSWLSTDGYYLGYYKWNQPKPIITAVYNVDSTTESTTLCDYVTYVTSMSVDGVKLDNISTTHIFSATGEHTVEFVLNKTEMCVAMFSFCNNLVKVNLSDGFTKVSASAFTYCGNLQEVTLGNNITTIELRAFDSCDSLSAITIPNSVTSINARAFEYCYELTSITLGSGLTFLDDVVFYGCSKLKTITSYAMTAPTGIGMHTFGSVATNGVLYVPSGATGYNAWMSTSKYRLGYYNWTQQTIS